MIYLFLFATVFSQQYIDNSIINKSLKCDNCHYSGNWLPLLNPLIFNHDLTQFKLNGMHKSANCIQCHQGETIKEIHLFSNSENKCEDCHLDIHYNRYGQDCNQCHNANSWNFAGKWSAHEMTMFPLVGAHKFINCNECHSQYSSEFLSTECISCHLIEYESQVSIGIHPENQNCELCHNTRTFIPSDMSKHDIFFPIYSGEHKGEWTSCNSECHISPNDFSQFSCGLNGVCHKHRKSKMEEEHDDENGFIYESSACFNCHPQGDDD